MPTDHDLETGTRPAAGLFADLQSDTVERHGVVLAHGTRFLVTEHLIEVHGTEGDPRGRRVAWRMAERRVVLRQEDLAQVLIGRRDRRDTRHAQLVHQPVLEGAIQPLAPPTRLRE